MKKHNYQVIISFYKNYKYTVINNNRCKIEIREFKPKKISARRILWLTSKYMAASSCKLTLVMARGKRYLLDTISALGENRVFWGPSENWIFVQQIKTGKIGTCWLRTHCALNPISLWNQKKKSTPLFMLWIQIY